MPMERQTRVTRLAGPHNRSRDSLEFHDRRPNQTASVYGTLHSPPLADSLD